MPRTTIAGNVIGTWARRLGRGRTPSHKVQAQTKTAVTTECGRVLKAATGAGLLFEKTAKRICHYCG